MIWIVLTLVLAVVSFWILTEMAVRKQKREKDQAATLANSLEETTYYGFPSKAVAEHVIQRISTGNDGAFNVSCPFCKADKKQKWDVLGLATFIVGSHTTFQSVILSCPKCASVRQVNPITLGAAEIADDGSLNWLNVD